MTREEWIERLQTLGTAALDPKQLAALGEKFELQELISQELMLDELLVTGLPVPQQLEAKIKVLTDQIVEELSLIDELDNDMDWQSTHSVLTTISGNRFAQTAALEFEQLDHLLDQADLPDAIANYQGHAAQDEILKLIGNAPASNSHNTLTTAQQSESGNSIAAYSTAAIAIVVIAGAVFFQFDYKNSEPQSPVVKRSNSETKSDVVILKKEPAPKADNTKLSDKVNQDFEQNPDSGKKSIQPPEKWLPKDTKPAQNNEPGPNLVKRQPTKPPVDTIDNPDRSTKANPSVETPAVNENYQEILLAEFDPVDRAIILNQDFVEELDEAKEYDVVMSAELLSLVDEDDLE